MWYCPCGEHSRPVPTGHREISSGIVGQLIVTFECLPEGWLQ